MSDLTSPLSCSTDIELEEQTGENVAGHTGVLEAARRGDDKTLGDILRTNKEAFKAVDNDTGDKLLHVIARSEAAGSVECLRILLDDYKIDTESRNSKNETPLHVAAIGE